jgi:hypothetical protein
MYILSIVAWGVPNEVNIAGLKTMINFAETSNPA